MNEPILLSAQLPSDAFMCWKCQEINLVILRYRTLASRFTDELMLKGLQQLIDKLEKKALHPEPRNKLLARLTLAPQLDFA